MAIIVPESAIRNHNSLDEPGQNLTANSKTVVFTTRGKWSDLVYWLVSFHSRWQQELNHILGVTKLSSFAFKDHIDIIWSCACWVQYAIRILSSRGLHGQKIPRSSLLSDMHHPHCVGICFCWFQGILNQLSVGIYPIRIPYLLSSHAEGQIRHFLFWSCATVDMCCSIICLQSAVGALPSTKGSWPSFPRGRCFNA